MTDTLSVAEAKRRFSELIDRVQRGERFVVSRRGKPAVALVAADAPPGRSRGRPLGLAAMAGALAEWTDVDAFVAEVYAERRRARDRRPPRLG